uniref:Uncharacterized protein n=1 Tax=Chrysotila carterae TaxID=13221 RepID=A0A7S4ETG5_CHRCT
MRGMADDWLEDDVGEAGAAAEKAAFQREAEARQRRLASVGFRDGLDAAELHAPQQSFDRGFAAGLRVVLPTAAMVGAACAAVDVQERLAIKRAAGDFAHNGKLRSGAGQEGQAEGTIAESLRGSEYATFHLQLIKLLNASKDDADYMDIANGLMASGVSCDEHLRGRLVQDVSRLLGDTCSPAVQRGIHGGTDTSPLLQPTRND